MSGLAHRDVLVHHHAAGRRADDAADLVAHGQRHAPPASAHARTPRVGPGGGVPLSRCSAARGIAPSEWLTR